MVYQPMEMEMTEEKTEPFESSQAGGDKHVLTPSESVARLRTELVHTLLADGEAQADRLVSFINAHRYECNSPLIS